GCRVSSGRYAAALSDRRAPKGGPLRVASTTARWRGLSGAPEPRSASTCQRAPAPPSHAVAPPDAAGLFIHDLRPPSLFLQSIPTESLWHSSDREAVALG